MHRFDKSALARTAATVGAAAVLSAACSAPSSEAGLVDRDADPQAKYLEQEHHLAECMQEKGFPYQVFMPPNEDPATGGTETYDVEVDNPNYVYMSQLSPEERAEWEEAMWGSKDPADGSFGGCNAAAFEATYGFTPQELIIDEDLLAQRDAAIDADPRVKEAAENYGSCMSDQGFDVPSPEQFDARVQAERQALREEAGEKGSDPEDLPEWEELIEFEAALQDAHVTCAEEEYYPVRAAVQTELDPVFLGDTPFFDGSSD